jgi:hypothetical protein
LINSDGLIDLEDASQLRVIDGRIQTTWSSGSSGDRHRIILP